MERVQNLYNLLFDALFLSFLAFSYSHLYLCESPLSLWIERTKSASNCDPGVNASEATGFALQGVQVLVGEGALFSRLVCCDHRNGRMAILQISPRYIFGDRLGGLFEKSCLWRGRQRRTLSSRPFWTANLVILVGWYKRIDHCVEIPGCFKKEHSACSMTWRR